jgi:hypothetical protein
MHPKQVSTDMAPQLLQRLRREAAAWFRTGEMPSLGSAADAQANPTLLQPDGADAPQGLVAGILFAACYNVPRQALKCTSSSAPFPPLAPSCARRRGRAAHAGTPLPVRSRQAPRGAPRQAQPKPRRAPLAGSWTVHYSANPLEAFEPLRRQQIADAAARAGVSGGSGGGSGVGVLEAAAAASLARLVSEYQAAVRGAGGGAASAGAQAPRSAKSGRKPAARAAPGRAPCAARFALWGGDALSLCAGAGAEEALPRDLRFHAIDVSNLPDHVGLANVLLLAGPRLAAGPAGTGAGAAGAGAAAPGAASRLYLDLMVWATSGADSLQVGRGVGRGRHAHDGGAGVGGAGAPGFAVRGAGHARTRRYWPKDSAGCSSRDVFAHAADGSQRLLCLTDTHTHTRSHTSLPPTNPTRPRHT